jgi:hypothetical protein
VKNNLSLQERWAIATEEAVQKAKRMTHEEMLEQHRGNAEFSRINKKKKILRK